MTRSRTSLRDGQRSSTSSEEESSDAKSPKDEMTPSRGRRRQHDEDEAGDMMDVKD